MEANYRIVKLNGKYYPQCRQPHIVDRKWIHEWSFFQKPNGDSLGCQNFEDALQACLDCDKTDVVEEVTDILINNGEVVYQKKTYMNSKERRTDL